MSSALTPEQKQKIEENRRKALEKRAAVQSTSKNTSTIFHSPVSKPTVNVNNKSIHQKPVSYFNKNTNVGNNYKQTNFSKKSLEDGKSNYNNSKQWIVSSEPLKCTLHLIARDRFAADVPFHEKVIEFFKSFPGRQYDPDSKSWNFPLEIYNEFKEKANSLGSLCKFGSLPAGVLKIFSKVQNKLLNEKYKDIDMTQIDSSLLNCLFPFQKEGVKFGIEKKGKCLIADEMGLGKTLQALAIADYYKSDWPLLIVCPSSMRFQWEEEIYKNLPSVPSYKTFVVVNRKDYIENASIVIISYDLMWKMKEFLQNYSFGFMIMDESHSLKSFKTQRTKAALELTKSCRRLILLSGTPALSRPAELFTQIKIISPYLFKDMIEFGVRYCEGKQDKFGWNFNGSSNLQELRLILEEELMIRRLKADVMDQLPSKMRQVVILNQDSIDTKSKTMNHFAEKLGKGVLKGAEKRSMLLSYFSETGRVKVKALCEHIEKLVEQDKKFLCFGHHKEVLDNICKTLEKLETYYIRIDGSVSSEERKAVCDQFQEEDKFKVAVLSIKAANTGITLTAANLVVFAELFWNPGELIQAEDRAHRMGQKDSVMVQYLIAKNTADDYLWPLVQTKLNVLSKAGLSKDAELEIERTTNTNQERGIQMAITDFFTEIEDDDLDDFDLSNVLDEIEGIPQKKRKTDD